MYTIRIGTGSAWYLGAGIVLAIVGLYLLFHELLHDEKNEKKTRDD